MLGSRAGIFSHSQFYIEVALWTFFIPGLKQHEHKQNQAQHLQIQTSSVVWIDVICETTRAEVYPELSCLKYVFCFFSGGVTHMTSHPPLPLFIWKCSWSFRAGCNGAASCFAHKPEMTAMNVCLPAALCRLRAHQTKAARGRIRLGPEESTVLQPHPRSSQLVSEQIKAPPTRRNQRGSSSAACQGR